LALNQKRNVDEFKLIRCREFPTKNNYVLLTLESPYLSPT